jgi:hypothetical protein
VSDDDDRELLCYALGGFEGMQYHGAAREMMEQLWHAGIHPRALTCSQQNHANVHWAQSPSVRESEGII